MFGSVFFKCYQKCYTNQKSKNANKNEQAVHKSIPRVNYSLIEGPNDGNYKNLREVE